ncbi:pseudouridine synthase [Lentisphaera profundi]|uniref:Pseudouridine synthase n=1 Tax=Lentisphaera profundi TaxID=1658616 RepID=A0ABY7VPI7_9BACT|nr:pseudouridine synthase [Lentisphaera profundi]WDE95897.1 pseudouridine synthase [Lentisphaera profundi]
MNKFVPSKIWLPKEASHISHLDFFNHTFPQIPAETWIARFQEGKITDLEQKAIPLQSAYQGNRHLIYYREVEDETPIPFEGKILFEDENLIVVDKPHFLPIHPAGPYVKETLVYRLRESQNNPHIAPLHRIDRLTAGLVLFSKNIDARRPYQMLFSERLIEKTYLAISKGETPQQKSWHLHNRIVPGDPWFLSAIGSGEPNSESFIEFIDQQQDLIKFKLKPVSGKKHQLRLHLASIGYPILHDPLYPDFTSKPPDDYAKALQLLAQSISFIDPLSKKKMSFQSELKLSF